MGVYFTCYSLALFLISLPPLLIEHPYLGYILLCEYWLFISHTSNTKCRDRARCDVARAPRLHGDGVGVVTIDNFLLSQYQGVDRCDKDR